MREIKNNKVDVAKVQPKPEAKPEKKEAIPFQGAADEAVVKDFSNPKAESLGRSQVEKPDALAKDVAFGMNHPDTIASADKFFDIAYAQLSAKKDPNAYGKASELTSVYANEVVGKIWDLIEGDVTPSSSYSFKKLFKNKA